MPSVCKIFFIYYSVLIFPVYILSQNDVDYLLYCRTEPGGSPRFTSMGGALGALGADMSCSSFNPAGLGLITRVELNYAFGLSFRSNTTILENHRNSKFNSHMLFSSFGAGAPYPGRHRNDVRNFLSISVNQLANFNNSLTFSQPSTLSTMNKDMLYAIKLHSKAGGNLNGAYEGLGYNTYLLDYDSASKSFFSFSDTLLPVALKRDIDQKGRLNETAISFAQSIGDEWYWGISMGIQNIRFTHRMVHSEADDQNLMQITSINGNSVTTYSTPPPYYYDPLYGFHRFTYKESYTTEGKGINLKAGFIYRVDDATRLGFYAHSPTYFDLNDEYLYSMSASFDGTTQALSAQYPENKGVFDYSMNTPWRLAGSIGHIIQKKIALGFDAEWIHYGSGKFSNDDYPSLFEGVNLIIERKYRSTFNFRSGLEWNLYPFFLRAGYVHLGSPLGPIFSSRNVVHIPSLGFGFRKKYFYMDFAFSLRLEKTDYYLYMYYPTQAEWIKRTGIFSVLVGFKL